MRGNYHLIDLLDITPIDERRHSDRAFLTVAVTLEIGERIIRGSECRNVSLGGMFVVSEVHIPIGTVGTTTLTKRCDKRRMSFSADFEVVRHEKVEGGPGLGLGLKFIRLTDEDREALAYIVEFRTGVTMREKLDLSESKFGDVTFRVAQSADELEGAFRLVHDSYVARGYMDPDSTGLRLSIFHAMPLTTIAVGVSKGKVIATAALFLDSQIGLPMDHLYRRELLHFRQNRRLIAEIGAFAVDHEFRAFTTTLVLHLQKLIFLYTFRYLNLDDIVMTINPRHKLYYQHVLLATQFGTEKVYHKVKGNPAIAMVMDIRKAKERLRETYELLPPERNLYHFFYEKNSECIAMPESRGPLTVWNASLLNYFFREKTNTFKDAPAATVKYILDFYHDREP